MPWVVYRNGNIQNVNQADYDIILASVAGSGLTEAQAQSSLARGSARLTLMPAAAVERIRAYRQSLSPPPPPPPATPTPALFQVGEPGEVIIQAVVDETPTNGEPEMAVGDATFLDMSEGEDIRDGSARLGVADEGENPDAIISAGIAGPALVAAAMLLLRGIMRGATRITSAHWGRLPGWAQTALAAIGFGVAIDLATDIPGVPGESVVLDIFQGDGPTLPTHLVDGHLGAHIVGSWEANGVTFYRLMDGRLAVQNKRGRWKVWRPKRPVVLMPGGANNLKTLLKADRILTAQSKKIAAMLNRRAPRPRKSAPGQPKGVVVVQNDGKSTTF